MREFEVLALSVDFRLQYPVDPQKPERGVRVVYRGGGRSDN